MFGSEQNREISRYTVYTVEHSGSLTMVPTCKNVALYSPTPLNVGTMVNAPLYNSLYFFLSFLCHPYILTIFAEKLYV